MRPFIVALALLGIVVQSARADDDIDPKAKTVCDRWKDRQDRLPAVRYHYNVETWVAADKMFGTPEIKKVSEWVVCVDAKTGRYRFESLQPRGDEWEKRVSVFNGTEIQTTYFRAAKDGSALPGEKPEVFVGRGDFSSVAPFEGGLEQPVLISHGVVSLTKSAFARPGRIHFLPDAANLYFHHDGKSGGKAVEVYRTYPFSVSRDYKEMDVDPGRNSVVLSSREVRGNQDQVFWNTTISYARVGGHDLLSGYKFESFEGKAVRMRHSASDIRSELLTAPPDSDFNLALSEGQVVTLQTFKKGDAPQVPKIDDSVTQYTDGKLVPVTVDSEGNVRPVASLVWVWVVIAVSLIAIVAGAVFMRSRWRRR